MEGLREGAGWKARSKERGAGRSATTLQGLVSTCEPVAMMPAVVSTGLRGSTAPSPITNPVVHDFLGDMAAAESVHSTWVNGDPVEACSLLGSNLAPKAPSVASS